MPKKRHPTGGELDDSDAYLSALGNEIDFVGDTLGATQWRQDIDSAPLAQIAEQALRGETPPSAPALTEGEDMSIADEVGQFRMLANSVPTNVLQTAKAELTNLQDAGTAILAGMPAANEFIDMIAMKQADLDTAMASLIDLQSEIEGLADRLMGGR